MSDGRQENIYAGNVTQHMNMNISDDIGHMRLSKAKSSARIQRSVGKLGKVRIFVGTNKWKTSKSAEQLGKRECSSTKGTQVMASSSLKRWNTTELPRSVGRRQELCWNCAFTLLLFILYGRKCTELQVLLPPWIGNFIFL
jgi:hypothetical protein